MPGAFPGHIVYFVSMQERTVIGTSPAASPFCPQGRGGGPVARRVGPVAQGPCSWRTSPASSIPRSQAQASRTRRPRRRPRRHLLLLRPLCPLLLGSASVGSGAAATGPASGTGGRRRTRRGPAPRQLLLVPKLEGQLLLRGVGRRLEVTLCFCPCRHVQCRALCLQQAVPSSIVARFVQKHVMGTPGNTQSFGGDCEPTPESRLVAMAGLAVSCRWFDVSRCSRPSSKGAGRTTEGREEERGENPRCEMSLRGVWVVRIVHHPEHL